MSDYVKAHFVASRDKKGNINFVLKNSEEIKQQLAAKFLVCDTTEAELSACVRSESGPKTNDQLRFIRGPLIDMIHKHLFDCGYEYSRQEVYNQLKMLFYNESKENESLKNGGFERVRDYIGSLVRFALVDLGIDLGIDLKFKKQDKI